MSLVAALPSAPAAAMELRGLKPPPPAPSAVDVAPLQAPPALKTTAAPAEKAPPERIPARGYRTLVVPQPKRSALYERTFLRLLAQPDKTDRYDALILKYSAVYKLDPRIVKALIAAESQFDPGIRSPMGARGLMQVLPRTAEAFGVAGGGLEDPEQNIRAGTAYLAYLFERAFKRYRLRGVAYSDSPLWVLQRVIAAYNEGPQALTRRTWFRQTRHYVWKVLLYRKSGVSEIRGPFEPAGTLSDADPGRMSGPFF